LAVFQLRPSGCAGSVVAMNPPRAQPEDYIQFLLATPRACTATEAARVQPVRPATPAHDAFTRLLHRLEPDPATLWAEVGPLVRRRDGVLVVDDTTLDKPHAHHIQLVTRHWSGKHWQVVSGINLITLVWTDGDRLYPTDYRLYHKAADGKTKNDHFRDLVAEAHARGFRPRCVLFDSWYTSLDNLKQVRALGWVFLARLKGNRLVRLDRGAPTAVEQLPIAAAGTVVWLPGFGQVKVFRAVAPDGDAEHWVTNDVGLDELGRVVFAELAWSVEEYHRGLKQYTGAERCQARYGPAQRNHIGLAIRAFVRLEWHRFTTGVSWFEAKMAIIRDAVRAYLACPTITLPTPATA
jgi:putative transposase